MWGKSLFFWVIILSHIFFSTNIYADEYNDDYYYEEEILPSGDVNSEDLRPTAQGDCSFGFLRNSGGGLIKVKRLLVNDEYLNFTRDYYDCLKQEDLIVPMFEPNTTEEVEISIDDQVAAMKNRLEQSLKSALKSFETGEEDDSGADSEASKNGTDANTTVAESKKRLSFREKQALRIQERLQKEAEREQKVPKFRLGADCETLICGSCKAIVEEFGYVVSNAVSNPSIKYIDQLTEGFCETKQIHLKYKEQVFDLCQTFDKDELGYKEALIRAFETHDNWNTVGSLSSILLKQRKVCLEVGACDPSQFEFQDKPKSYLQEQWNASCFVCQAFAKNLEERIHLSRFLTERTIVPVVQQTCDRLNLESEYDELCRKLIKGKLLEDIAWLSKVHEESIAKKSKAELRFPDKICQEIDWCEPWVDPEKLSLILYKVPPI